MPKPTEIKRLRDRWTPARVEELAKALRGAATWLPTEVDLQGFPLTKVAHLTAKDIDFSFAKSPLNSHGVQQVIQMFECHLERCRFEAVGHFHNVNGTFRACSFARAKGSNGGWTGTFEDCDFAAADLSSGRAYRSAFRRCDFTGAKLVRTGFGFSTFEGCRFGGTKWSFGSILGATFVDCDLTDVDFKDTACDATSTFDADCLLDGARFEDRSVKHSAKYYLGAAVYAELKEQGKVPLNRKRTKPT